MISIVVKCESKKEMEEKRGQFHNALVGSPAYINNEIAVCDESETEFLIVIGNPNDHNIGFSIESKDLNILEKYTNIKGDDINV